MVGWRDCKLGDLLQIKHGFAFLGEHFGGAGTHIVLTPGNFLEEGGFKEKSDKAKWYSGPIPSDYVLKEGDLIVAMTEQAEGLLGSSAIIPRSGIYLHNQRLGLVQIRDRKQADQHFIYYLFNSKSVRQQIRGSASGAKIRHTAPSRIADVNVSVPPLAVQRRIATILCAYDYLIENNTRRIQLLENMAQALYREWFVNFRFPGHAKVKLVESPLGKIPQGWQATRIGEVVHTLGGGTPSTKNPAYWEGGSIDWYSPSDLTAADAVFMFGSSRKITELGLQESSAKLFPANSVMMTSRATIGVVAINTTPATTNQGFITCTPNTRLCAYHLVEWIQQNMELIISVASGATFKEISRGEFRELSIALPPAPVERDYHVTVEPIYQEIRVLLAKNANLRRTRDLLLPKLISGALDVSKLEIEVSAAP